MTFSRPTRSTIQARVAADIERHSGQKATSRGDVYFPLAQAIAAVSHGLHGHLQYNADQLFDDSCSDENLLRRAAEMGIYQIQAIRASGTITVTGVDGTTIYAETLLQTDDEIKYLVTEEAVIEDGSATVSVKAVVAGADGNQDAGVILRFIKTQTDLDSEATVISISAGSDIETIARVRERLSNRRKKPPMGGNKNDYIQWTLAAHSDITRAWCTSAADENEANEETQSKEFGTVTIRFVTEDLESPIPTQAIADDVKAYIKENRPIGVHRVDVEIVQAKELNLEFSLLETTASAEEEYAAVGEAIKAELNDLLRREGEPGGIIRLSQIHEAISLAAGEVDHRITLEDDVSCLPGEFLVLGEITWPETTGTDTTSDE